MNTDDLTSHLILEACPGIGPVNFRKLLDSSGYSPTELINLPSQQLTDIGFNPQQISALTRPDSGAIDKALQWQEERPDHQILTLDHPNYPTL